MKLVCIFMMMLSLNPLTHAQNQDNILNDELIKKTQEDFFVVVGAGIGGAVLGLSTLSFVEKPARHVYKVWMGASLGVIAGVLYVIYNRAQAGTADLRASRDFQTNERSLWHESSVFRNTRSLISEENLASSSSAFQVNLLRFHF